MGRRGDARPAPVPGGQDARHVRGVDAPLAHLHQGAGHDPHHVHEEAVAFEHQVQPGSVRLQAGAVHLPARGGGRAFAVPEAGEVMLAHQVRRGIGHGGPVQGPGAVDVPAAQVLERVRGGALLDPVDVALGHGVGAGEEAFGRRLRRHGPGIPGQVRVDGRQQPVGVPGPGHQHQHPLRPGMHAGVGAAGAGGHGDLGIEGLERLPQIALDAAQAGLDLPAEETFADVGHAQEIGDRHAPILLPGGPGRGRRPRWPVPLGFPPGPRL